MGQLAIPAIGIAMQTGAGILEAKGQSEALGFRAGQAQVASRQGRIAAAETDTQLREELRTVIGNIRAVRASSGVAPDSPTTRAIEEEEGRISERQRRIRVGNIMMQSREDARSASFLKGASRDAFLYGTIGALGRGFSTAASAAAGGGPG